jgi:hypothetical protein
MHNETCDCSSVGARKHRHTIGLENFEHHGTIAASITKEGLVPRSVGLALVLVRQRTGQALDTYTAVEYLS